MMGCEEAVLRFFVGLVWPPFENRFTDCFPHLKTLQKTKPTAMPIYAYKCADCGFEKDVIQKFSDAPLSTCPACGAQAFSKQLTAPAFQLKGSGWYVTDFRDGGRKKAPDSQASEDKGGSDGKTEDAGTTAKPEAAEAKADQGANGEKSKTSKPESATQQALPASGAGKSPAPAPSSASASSSTAASS